MNEKIQEENFTIAVNDCFRLSFYENIKFFLNVKQWKLWKRKMSMINNLNIQVNHPCVKISCAKFLCSVSVIEEKYLVFYYKLF